MERQSAGLTDTASTFTKTSSAAGVGFSTSAIRSVSGGPYLSNMNAFITGAPGFLLASSSLMADTSKAPYC